MSFVSKLLGKGAHSEPEPPSDPLDAFWAWWREANVQLAKAYDSGRAPSEELTEAISDHVHAMDEELAWETGPGKSSDHHFALSAEGDARLRVLTQRWLSRAPPACKSWEYYPARQASGADPRQVLCVGDNEFAYGDFRIAAERDDTRAVANVVIYHPLFKRIEEHERSLPTFLFLDDVLGEDGVTSWIGSVDAVSDEPDEADSATALVEMIRELRTNWSDEVVSILEAERDGTPMLAVVRLGLKRLDHLLHDHHLELSLTLKEVGDTGLCSAEEVSELSDFEEGLIDAVKHRAIWIGHETHRGVRTIHFHADSSAALQDEIVKFCQVHAHWKSDLTVTYDPGWEILYKY